MHLDGSTSSRLRRGDSAGWGRHEKAPRYSKGRYSIERHSPVPARGIARYLGSDIGHREDSYEAMSFMSVLTTFHSVVPFIWKNFNLQYFRLQDREL